MLDAKTKALKIIAERTCPNILLEGCRGADEGHFCAACIAREALRGSYRISTKQVELKCERA